MAHAHHPGNNGNHRANRPDKATKENRFAAMAIKKILFPESTYQDTGQTD